MRRGFAARKKRAAVALSLVFLCLFSACAMQGRNASKPTWLTVGTADAGGSMYANGSELAAAITARDAGLRFNLKASTGSPGNLKALLSGEVDLALITADIAAKAREEAGGECQPLDGAPGERNRHGFGTQGNGDCHRSREFFDRARFRGGARRAPFSPGGKILLCGHRPRRGTCGARRS